MMDATSTSFGLLIAYLLPGLAALYALSFWSLTTRTLLDTFLKVHSDVGLFLFVVLVALIAGLYVAMLRSLIFESWLCKGNQLVDVDYGKLGAETKLSAFRAAVDENFRYHQFFGGMCIVIPVLFVGWLKNSWSDLTVGRIVAIVLFVLVELVTGYFAQLNYMLFTDRTRKILDS